MKSKSKSNFFKANYKGITILFVIIVAVSFSLVTSEILQPVVKESIEIQQQRRTQRIYGDAIPSGDNSGFNYIMIYPHQASPAVAYASNLSNSSAAGGAYEFSDSVDTEMTNETPHSTTFDLVIKFRVNDTVNYNTSGSKWMPDWIYCNATIDFDFAADTGWDAMTLVEIFNNSDFCWYHGYLNNAGSGFTITHAESQNQTVNLSAIW
jgi:hypothetical protein